MVSAGELLISIVADAAQFFQTTGKVKAEVAGLDATPAGDPLAPAAEKAGMSAAKIGAATAGVGLALTGVGIAAGATASDVNASFVDFDKSLAGIKSIGATAEEIDAVRSSAIGLSKELPVGAQAVVDSAYLIKSAGFQDLDLTTPLANGKTALQTLAETAVAGGEDITGVTDSIITALGAGFTDIDKTTAALANGVRLGKYEMDDFGTMMQKNIATGAGLGMSLDEIAAANVLLQNSFASAEEGGTGLKTLLSSLVDPKKVKDLEAMGVKVKDADGNFVGLESVLKQLKPALEGTGGNVEQQGKLFGIFGEYGVRAAQGLLQNVDAFGQYTSEMGKSSTVQDMMNAQLESTSSKLEIAQNKTIAAKIALGEAMAPATELAAAFKGDLAAAIEGLPGPLQNLAGGALVAAQNLTALGPAIAGIGGIVAVIPSITQTTGALSGAGGLTEAVAAVAESAASVPDAVAPVTAAFTPAVASVDELAEAFQGVDPSVIARAFGGVDEVVVDAGAGIAELTANIAGSADELAGIDPTLVTRAFDNLGPAASKADDALGILAGSSDEIMEALGGIDPGKLGGILDDLPAKGPAAGTALKAVAGSMDDVVGAIGHINPSVMAGALDDLAPVAEKAGGGIAAKLVGAVGGGLGGLPGVLSGGIGSAFSGVGGMLSGAMGGITGALSGLGGMILPLLTNPITLAIGAIALLAGGIILLDQKFGFIKPTLDWFGKAFEGIAGFLSSTFGPILQGITGFFNELFSATGAGGGVVQGLMEWFGGLGTTLLELGGAVAEVVGPAIQELATAIGETLGPLIKEAFGVLGEVGKFLADTFGPAIEWVTKSVGGFFAAFSPDKQSPIKGFISILGVAWKAVDALFTAMRGDILGAGKKFQEAQEAFANLGKESANAATAVDSSMKKIPESVGTELGKAGDTSRQKLEQMKLEAGQKTEEMKMAMAKQYLENVENVDACMELARKGLDNKLGLTAENAATRGAEIKNNLKAEYEQNVVNADKAFTDAKNGIDAKLYETNENVVKPKGAAIRDSMTQSWTETTDNTKTGWQNIENETGAGLDNTKGEVDTKKPGIVSAADLIWDGIRLATPAGWIGIVGEVANGMLNTKGKVDETRPGIVGSADQTWSDIATNVPGGFSPIESAVASAMGRVASAFRSVISGMETAWTNFVSWLGSLTVSTPSSSNAPGNDESAPPANDGQSTAPDNPPPTQGNGAGGGIYDEEGRLIGYWGPNGEAIYYQTAGPREAAAAQPLAKTEGGDGALLAAVTAQTRVLEKVLSSPSTVNVTAPSPLSPREIERQQTRIARRQGLAYGGI